MSPLELALATSSLPFFSFAIVMLFKGSPPDDNIIFGILGMFVGVGLLLAAFFTYENRKWELFIASHNCKVVAKIYSEPSSFVGVSLNGKISTAYGQTSSKTGYLCDDGITYYR